MPWGLDSLGVRRPIPLVKALDEDTLLVYAMNDAPLPADHGYPARLLVPGWVGVASIKWVERIEVSEQARYSPWNATTYRLFGDAYRPGSIACASARPTTRATASPTASPSTPRATCTGA
jgi:DMSO/TMAO reductase YedYZ molybdopterin-dependent catalytic subunit